MYISMTMPLHGHSSLILIEMSVNPDGCIGLVVGDSPRTPAPTRFPLTEPKRGPEQQPSSSCPGSMAVGCPMPPLVLGDNEVQQLQSIANSRSLPHSIAQRAQIDPF